MALFVAGTGLFMKAVSKLFRTFANMFMNELQSFSLELLFVVNALFVTN